MDDEFDDVADYNPTGEDYDDNGEYDENYTVKPEEEEGAADDEEEDIIKATIEGTPGEEPEEDPDEDTEQKRIEELEKIEELEESLEGKMPEAPPNITSLCPNPNRRTEPVMTRFERARVLGSRARLIEKNSLPMVDPKGEIDPVKIATMELEAGVMPLKIRRRLPDGTCEEWKVSELEWLG